MEQFNDTALILLDDILQDEAILSFIQAVKNDDLQCYAKAYRLLLEQNMHRNLSAYFTQKILYSENLFSKRCVFGTMTDDIRYSFAHDLAVLQNIAHQIEQLPPSIRKAIESGFPALQYGNTDDLFGAQWNSNDTLMRLEKFYRKNGYGLFIGHKAFTFENGHLCSINNTSDITLSDLKDYSEEKAAVENNIINLIKGLPYCDMLLYGDKGTGKSSTVHAILNKYAEYGLRAVEIEKENIGAINSIKELLADLPFKFIIFIDDLSLNDGDNAITSLKASLEGSLTEKSNNIMITATSNRRHIVKESFSERDNSIHAHDTMEEQLSLFDRFGLTVCFSSTGKKEYLSIIKQLADDFHLTTPTELLFSLAERWALEKGGRSPRRARQFAEFAYSCQAKNIPIEF